MRISNLVLGLIILLAVVLIGCGTIADHFTPAEIPERTATYVSEDPQLPGLTNLHKAKKVKREVVIVHRDNQIDLKRMAEDDKLKYKDAFQVIDFNIEESTALQNVVLNGNAIWPGMNSILFGAGGLLAGRNFFKRPGDYGPDEIDESEQETTA